MVKHENTAGDVQGNRGVCIYVYHRFKHHYYFFLPFVIRKYSPVSFNIQVITAGAITHCHPRRRSFD